MQIPTLTPDYQLGMSDLLPPSPSAANYSSRAFAPSLSTLSSSVPSTEASAVRNIAASASASTTSLGLPHANSPPLSDPSYSYSNNTSFNSGAPNVSFRPAIRPLDFGALMLSHEGTHAELARTVADLTQWLSVVEVGLSGMLDTAADEDTIAEEQEDHATERTELLIR
jgi:protein-serine/threonine kinase